MKNFLDENFILQTETAQKLYHEHAKNLPIIDYHCHLNPKFIAENRQFDNLSQIWLEGDHYKWRAMRANGIHEDFITGKADDFTKFQKWAETVPYALRNPLYHWTHLELKNPFGISKILNADSAKEIYDEASAMLRTPEYSVQGILKKMNVEVVCTTDDPIDSLEYHKMHRDNKGETKMYPTWRPDKAMAVENQQAYNDYIAQLEKAADMHIGSFDDLIVALKKRQNFFESLGCRLADHGIETFYSEDYKDNDIKLIFLKVRGGRKLDQDEILKFKSAMLYNFAAMEADKGWTTQYHFGVLRNNNTKMFRQAGADTGFDAIGDFEIGRHLSKFFDRLTLDGKLGKSILYNLNPRDNELVVTLALAYNDGSVAGQMQFGSGWWFLDQKDGMEKQMNALSTLGLLSRFIGMLTDSRSFLSFPRHEYFRRILCNLVGRDIENGEIPVQEMKFVEQMIENISYYNAKNYFKF